MVMSSEWVKDIAHMQEKFGIREWMEDPKNADKLFEKFMITNHPLTRMAFI